MAVQPSRVWLKSPLVTRLGQVVATGAPDETAVGSAVSEGVGNMEGKMNEGSGVGIGASEGDAEGMMPTKDVTSVVLGRLLQAWAGGGGGLSCSSQESQALARPRIPARRMKLRMV